MKSIEEYKKEVLLNVMNGELSWEYIKTLPKDDDLRTFMCELGPESASGYAYYVDKSPHEETRKAVCRDPGWAYLYALEVDKSPRDDIRKAACGDPEFGYWYACDVDKSPREDTREAAYRDPQYKNWYIEEFGE